MRSSIRKVVRCGETVYTLSSLDNKTKGESNILCWFGVFKRGRTALKDHWRPWLKKTWLLWKSSLERTLRWVTMLSRRPWRLVHQVLRRFFTTTSFWKKFNLIGCNTIWWKLKSWHWWNDAKRCSTDSEVATLGAYSDAIAQSHFGAPFGAVKSPFWSRKKNFWSISTQFIFIPTAESIIKIHMLACPTERQCPLYLPSSVQPSVSINCTTGSIPWNTKLATYRIFRCTTRGFFQTLFLVSLIQQYDLCFFIF